MLHISVNCSLIINISVGLKVQGACKMGLVRLVLWLGLATIIGTWVTHACFTAQFTCFHTCISVCPASPLLFVYVIVLLVLCCYAEMAKQDLNTYIGDMGPYQWRVFITVFIFAIYTADAIHIIFIAGKMPHWCRVPELDDLPYDVQKEVAIPAQSTDHDGSVEYSSCEMFSLNYSVYNSSQFYSWNRSLMSTNQTSLVQCSQWTYDQSQFISTIVSKVWYEQILENNVTLPLVHTACIRQPLKPFSSDVNCMRSISFLPHILEFEVKALGGDFYFSAVSNLWQVDLNVLTCAVSNALLEHVFVMLLIFAIHTADAIHLMFSVGKMRACEV